MFIEGFSDGLEHLLEDFVLMLFVDPPNDDLKLLLLGLDVGEVVLDTLGALQRVQLRGGLLGVF